MATLRESHAWLESAKGDEMPEEVAAARLKIIEAMERMLRKDGAIMVASLMGAGRESEARAVAVDVRRMCPGPETKRQLLETVRQAGVSDP
jgi:hypothetical protein